MVELDDPRRKDMLLLFEPRRRALVSNMCIASLNLANEKQEAMNKEEKELRYNNAIQALISDCKVRYSRRIQKRTNGNIVDYTAMLVLLTNMCESRNEVLYKYFDFLVLWRGLSLQDKQIKRWTNSRKHGFLK